MDVILKQDIANLGYRDDIISVKDGYARNYLIPQGIAVNATADNQIIARQGNCFIRFISNGD